MSWDTRRLAVQFVRHQLVLAGGELSHAGPGVSAALDDLREALDGLATALHRAEADELNEARSSAEGRSLAQLAGEAPIRVPPPKIGGLAVPASRTPWRAAK